MKRKPHQSPPFLSVVLTLLLLLNSFAAKTIVFGQTAATVAKPAKAPTAAAAAAAAVTSEPNNDALALGNPSGAKTDLRLPDNYLVAHKGFVLSYNKSRGAANWVAWHLEKSDIGDAERTNAFAPDQTLPGDWWIRPTDYIGSGYDRGHLCPSKDRSSSEDANRTTFLMSNMQPQAPKLNQKTWKYLEDYTRETVRNDEAYVYAGCYGDAGRLKDKITIPTRCWKIVVFLATGDKDAKRVDKNTRIIAVDMPNDETVSSRWRTYLTTVDDIEKNTGYDFLSNLPKKIQAMIESKKDVQSEPGTAEEKPSEPKTPVKEKEKAEANQSKTNQTTPAKKADEGERTYIKGARGGCYYLSESGRKVYVKDKSLCGN